MTSPSLPLPARSEGWGVRLLAFLERSHARALAILVVLSLVSFLPGFVTLQPFDRDEPRFAQASKQMLESGDFIDIRFQDEGRHKKPVGIYWLQAAVVSAAEAAGVPEARTTIALYRLPSLVGAITVVLATYWAALVLLSGQVGVPARRAAFLAGAFMAGAILLGVEARIAKTDATLAACSVVAMAVLARAFLNRLSPLPAVLSVIFWLAVGLSILIKGPLLLMVGGLAAAVLSIRDRSARWLLGLRPLWGLAIVAAITVPWFLAIWLKTGGAFFAESVGKDMLAKAQSGQERHWGPPGTYLLAFFGTFWPAAIFTAIGVPAFWRERRMAWVAFCLAWIVPAWLVFEVLPTKLPHYVLPVYPAIAILTAWALLNGDVHRRRPLATIATVLIPAIPLAIAAGLGVFAFRYDGTMLGPALPGFALAVGLALWSWLAFVRDRAVSSALLGVVSSLALSVSVFGVAQPLIPSLKLSPRLAAAARSLDCAEPRLATTSYREPSLIFLTRTDLVLTDGAGAAAFLAGGNCRMAFVEKRDEDAFAAHLSQTGLTPALVTRVRGFNINGGRQLDIGVYRTGREGASPPAAQGQQQDR
ncbi:4-amino-4-deoxy-L-arabinose transferase-like glycosyltransferase [Pseudochelatococcus lubricantis]|uniref:4-amino-4-deoxy-L-arabinose transferase-like glycosyltransferase n=1 Tax=Pseudochelatococcus lubricantis TaxID=1538102 RepID=A0ABX0V443_9HYPH|nr:glycosyltransferase family 39 protein [Pseudochelatococcus lubricantis]NIJ58570.1 4-amino-4-deoxy-L-arabinose transferase-like glycosyltransferase [Pseudochelatococcus lubricantis]